MPRHYNSYCYSSSCHSQQFLLLAAPTAHNNSYCLQQLLPLTAISTARSPYRSQQLLLLTAAPATHSNFYCSQPLPLTATPTAYCNFHRSQQLLPLMTTPNAHGNFYCTIYVTKYNIDIHMFQECSCLVVNMVTLVHR
jgi:hypothetical protein